METFETDIEMDADTGPIRATGIFAIRSTTSEAEPYSWGGSRGTERETDATLMQITLGGLTLARELASQIVTPGELAQIEAGAADQWEVEQGLADAPAPWPIAAE